jgi:hypothetical protein
LEVVLDSVEQQFWERDTEKKKIEKLEEELEISEDRVSILIALIIIKKL